MGGSSVGLAKRGCYRCAGIDLRCNACREDLFLYPRPRIKNMFFNSYVQTSALTLAWLVMGGAGLAFGEVESKRASISRLVGQAEQNAQRASRISFTATFSIEQVAPAGSGVPRFIRGKGQFIKKDGKLYTSCVRSNRHAGQDWEQEQSSLTVSNEAYAAIFLRESEAFHVLDKTSDGHLSRTAKKRLWPCQRQIRWRMAWVLDPGAASEIYLVRLTICIDGSSACLPRTSLMSMS